MLPWVAPMGTPLWPSALMLRITIRQLTTSFALSAARGATLSMMTAASSRATEQVCSSVGVRDRPSRAAMSSVVA